MIPSVLPITVAIPTYRREAVLIDTLIALLALEHRAAEILVLDQTEKHESATERRLGEMAAAGSIRWLRLDRPSIPQAMNVGLLQASQPIVLFLDDDVRPEAGLVIAHREAHAPATDLLVAGRVIQPWEEGMDHSASAPFHFAGTRAQRIDEFMGGNFSIRRPTALALGGFDENFVRVAYRFEAEFAHRLRSSGRSIVFEPRACLHHLKAGSGGTRTYGEHLTTWRPDHAVGAYYYGLRTHELGVFATRPLRAVATRYHLRRPWRIPITLTAELGGMLWALGLFLRGPVRLAPDKNPHLT
jgi:GT2 family glycosyltransferase